MDSHNSYAGYIHGSDCVTNVYSLALSHNDYKSRNSSPILSRARRNFLNTKRETFYECRKLHARNFIFSTSALILCMKVNIVLEFADCGEAQVSDMLH